MGTRSNLKFESPPNTRGILALTLYMNVEITMKYFTNIYWNYFGSGNFKNQTCSGHRIHFSHVIFIELALYLYYVTLIYKHIVKSCI